MRLRLLTTIQEIESSQTQWDRVAGDFPFFRWSWMASWCRHLAATRKLAVLVQHDADGNWQGIAPFAIDSPVVGSRKLVLIGSGTVCSDYMNLIALPEYKAGFLDMAVAWITGNIGNHDTLGAIDCVELDGVTPTDPNTRLLVRLFGKAGFQVHETEIEGCWATNLPDNWEEFNRSLSKSFRRKTKKATQLLNGDDANVIRACPENFESVWKDFVFLHQKRRRMLGEPGCFADPDFESFLKDAVFALMGEGRADLLLIELAGRPFAVSLLLNDGERMMMYQSGMEPELKQLEPGHAQAVMGVQLAIENGYKTYDFLRGDEPYKSRWNTTRVGLSRFKLIAPQLSARLKHQIWLSGKSLKGYATRMGLLK